MTLHFSDLHREAGRSLAMASYSPRRLVLIHTTVSLGISLVVSLLDLLFFHMIEDTGGLGGIGTRSILQTVQSMIDLLAVILLPFWNISLIRASLCWARGERAEFPTLLEGFRRFRSVLGVRFFTLALYAVLWIALCQVGMTLFMLTPFSEDLMAVMEPIMEESGFIDPEVLMDEEFMAQYIAAAKPLLIFLGVLFLVGVVIIQYRIRFADFVMMDGNRSFRSLLQSFRITNKRTWAIFKIDLRFWWFYLLQFLTVAICYGDTILPALGVSLPISEDLSYVVFYAVGIVLQGLLLWWYQANVSTVYALAYETLSADAATVCSQTVQ